jgi:hypothetical protein
MNPIVRVLAKGKTKASQHREVVLVAGTAVGTTLLHQFLPSRMLFGMNDDEVINDQDQPWADVGTNEEAPAVVLQDAAQTAAAVGAYTILENAQYPEPPEPPAPTFRTIYISPCNIDDDMAFGTAFGTARKELGAGAVFEWRGKFYNTFYKSEWEDLGAEGRANFSAAINYTDRYYHAADADIDEPIYSMGEDDPIDLVIEDESDDEQPIELIVVDEIDEDDPIYLIPDEDDDEPILLGAVEENNQPQEYNHVSDDIPDLDISSDDIDLLVNHTDISNVEDVSDFV